MKCMKLLPKKTYLQMIQNSVGSSLFKNLYAESDGKEVDILKNGDLSCAFFVSTILNHFKLVDGPHATVDGLVRDMKKNGWKQTDSLEKGGVVVWEAVVQSDGAEHTHIGFYMGGNTAISNNPQGNEPFVHHPTFGEDEESPVREISALYSHDFLKS